LMVTNSRADDKEKSEFVCHYAPVAQVDRAQDF